MSRQPRLEFPGAIYHIVSRGNEKKDIFRENNDRVQFLKILDKVVVDHEWECYAYCLMDNHYHLLVHTPAPTLALGMKYLNGVYTQKFNTKYRRVGHLFQGRFFSKLVKDDKHVFSLARYIMQNPVRGGLSEDVAGWDWSSYKAIVGLSPCPSFLKVDFLLGLFSNDRESARRAFIEYVNIPAAFEPWMKLSDRTVKLRGNRYVVGLSGVIRSTTNKNERNREILDAYLNYGYPISAIAEFLDLSRARVHQIIKMGTTA